MDNVSSGGQLSRHFVYGANVYSRSYTCKFETMIKKIVVCEEYRFCC